MKYSLLIFVMLCVGHSVFAQRFPQDQWHRGTIFFEDNRQLSGAIKYNLEHDVVQWQNGSRIETFTAKVVARFRFFQNWGEMYRHFYSLEFSNDAGYRIPRFFEVVEEGGMTLLAREFVNTQATPGVYNRRNRRYEPGLSRQVLDHEFFFLDERGKIIPFYGKRKEILSIMADQSSEIKDYIKRERLRVDKLLDLAKLTAYYNSLL